MEGGETLPLLKATDVDINNVLHDQVTIHKDRDHTSKDCSDYYWIWLPMICLIFPVLCVWGTMTDPPHLPKLQVESVTVYPFYLSSSSSNITANWIVDLSIQDRNRPPPISGLYYENMKASVFFKNENISTTWFGPFFQNMDLVKLVRLNIVASSVSLNPTVAEAIIDERSRTGTVTFTFNLNATLFMNKYWGQIKNKYWGQMTASCRNLKVGFTSTSQAGTLLGGQKQCIVLLVD